MFTTTVLTNELNHETTRLFPHPQILQFPDTQLPPHYLTRQPDLISIDRSPGIASHQHPFPA